MNYYLLNLIQLNIVKRFLSVITKQSEIDPDDQTFVNNEPFLMAIYCENSLFRKFSAYADLMQANNWENHINHKLNKKILLIVVLSN